jgi:O-antigen chain-terminating methyltransferase
MTNFFYETNRFHLDDFTRLHNHAFIQGAFAGILKRDPDPQGLSHYMGALRSGRMSKAEVLGRLRYSPEGRMHKVMVRGLFWPFFRSVMGALPVIGHVVAMVEMAVGAPTFLRAFRAIENECGPGRENRDSFLANVIRDFNQELGGEFPESVYLALENEFRGSQEGLEKKLSRYLPEIRKAPVLDGGRPGVDLGCGRGEWLALLRKNGISAMGVDSNQLMVDRCREQGIKAFHGDMIDYLLTVKSGSLPFVTGFHIMEHVNANTLLHLWREVRRVLAPGGLLLFETPNPENVQVSTYYFYLDPTHRKPIPPPLATFTLDTLGFKEIRIIRASQYETPIFEDTRLNDFFCAPLDYAVLGMKPDK